MRSVSDKFVVKIKTHI